VAPQSKKKSDATIDKHKETFKRGLTSKLKIATGTVTFSHPGTNADEFEKTVKLGMTPPDEIQSVISTGAERLGRERSLADSRSVGRPIW
jgi:imidazolonepropionase-like amidohydrolase